LALKIIRQKQFGASGRNLMNRLKKHGDLVKALGKLNKRQFQEVIRHSKKDFIRCLCEIIHNVVTGNIKLKKQQLEKLRRCRKCLYKLCNKKLPLKQQKEALVQTGHGIFSVLLPSLITGLLGKLLRG